MNSEKTVDLANHISNTYANFRVLADIPIGDCDSIRTHLGMVKDNIPYLEKLDLGEEIKKQYVVTFDRSGLETLIEVAKKDSESYDLKYSNLLNARDTIARSNSKKVGEIILFMDDAFSYLPELNDKLIEQAEKYIEQIPADDLKKILDTKDTDSSDLLWTMLLSARGLNLSEVRRLVGKTPYEISKLNDFGPKHPAKDFLEISSEILKLTPLGRNAILYHYRDNPLELSIA